MIVAIRGAVVDIFFADGELPQIDEAILVEGDVLRPLIIEVQAHLGEKQYAGSRCRRPPDFRVE